MLCHAETQKVPLAIGQLGYVQPGDLMMFDYDYSAYLWFATLANQGIDFVGRCPPDARSAVQAMFTDAQETSQIVTFKVGEHKRDLLATFQLPAEITVRLVRFQHEDGQTEILVTSLYDETCYPTESFALITYAFIGLSVILTGAMYVDGLDWFIKKLYSTDN